MPVKGLAVHVFLFRPPPMGPALLLVDNGSLWEAAFF